MLLTLPLAGGCVKGDSARSNSKTEFVLFTKGGSVEREGIHGSGEFQKYL